MTRRLLAVGDGLSMYASCGWAGLHVDCGSQSGGAFAASRWVNGCSAEERWRTDAFLITHYHTDHYNGWVYASDAGSVPPLPYLSTLYHPRLPTPGAVDLLRATFALFALGSGTGSMEIDLWHRVARLSRRPVVRVPLEQGRRVQTSAGELHVIWPPHHIQGALSETIEGAVRKFHDALDRHTRLRELYEATESVEAYADGDKAPVRNRDRIDPWEREGRPRRQHEPLDPDHYESLDDMLPDEELREVNRALRDAANSLGLAFVLDRRVLCLGDLEGRALTGALSYLVGEGLIDFDVIVAPHHGTKWNREMFKLRGNRVEVSVGDRLWPKVKPELGRIARSVHFTHMQGDLVWHG
ncbi:MBL fold metallo-hydrolase [Rubricoccus marinus]|nr:MBL fold metallo-hydrolase [Rubricoccus marinus]